LGTGGGGGGAAATGGGTGDERPVSGDEDAGEGRGAINIVFLIGVCEEVDTVTATGMGGG